MCSKQKEFGFISRAARHRVLLGLISLCHAGVCSAVESTGETRTRNGAWSVGIIGARHALRGGDENAINGNSAELALGAAWIESRWYVNATYNITLGPFERAMHRQLEADNSGTAFAFWWGYSAQNMDLRTTDGGYGFSLGARYYDTTTRSSGHDRTAPLDTRNALERDAYGDYQLRQTNLSITPGVFFAWLKSARPYGNSPSLLMTRLEGQILTIGVAMPVFARYRARYDKFAAGSKLTEPPSHVTQSGELTGYTMLIEFTTMLGV